MTAHFVLDERLETLRDALRQAAVHSSSARTRNAAAAALEQPSDMSLLRVCTSLSCGYAPAPRRLIADYWGERS